MVTINRILCPVDFSGHSRMALDYATALNRQVTTFFVLLSLVSLQLGAVGMAASVTTSPTCHSRRSRDSRCSNEST